MTNDEGERPLWQNTTTTGCDQNSFADGTSVCESKNYFQINFKECYAHLYGYWSKSMNSYTFKIAVAATSTLKNCCILVSTEDNQHKFSASRHLRNYQVYLAKRQGISLACFPHEGFRVQLDNDFFVQTCRELWILLDQLMYSLFLHMPFNATLRGHLGLVFSTSLKAAPPATKKWKPSAAPPEHWKGKTHECSDQ